MQPSKRAKHVWSDWKPSLPLQAARFRPPISWVPAGSLRIAVPRTLGERIVQQDQRCTYGERLNIAPSGRRFRCNFIEPGLVSYVDCGGDVELLRQETIEAALHTALGNPLTVGHVRTNRLVANAHGRIENVGRDPLTGWFFADGSVDTDEARERIRNNERPSCGYRVTSFGPGGVWHNMPYAREITGIEFHHLAIVENPRYEGAKYRLNSKTQPAMKNPFKFLWDRIKPAAEAGGQPTTERAEAEVGPDATVEIDGKSVRLCEIVEAYKNPARQNEIKPESEIEFEASAGKTVKVKFSDLTQNYIDRQNGVESPEQKTARENSAKEAARVAAEELERQNAAKGNQSFKVLAAARTAPAQVAIETVASADTVHEQAARGATRYGSEKPGKN